MMTLFGDIHEARINDLHKMGHSYIDFKKAEKVLDLPKDRTLIELIPLGYPAYTPRKVPRKPLEDFVFKNKYGEK